MYIDLLCVALNLEFVSNGWFSDKGSTHHIDDVL